MPDRPATIKLAKAAMIDVGFRAQRLGARRVRQALRASQRADAPSAVPTGSARRG